jgi:4-amino-4-deoxy-L-arabinose transferase-like glycosyltransferase
MNTNATSKKIEQLTKRLTRQITLALILFSLAWFVLAVGIFTFYPLSIPGYICLGVGLVFMITDIVYFIRYARTSREVRKLQEQLQESGG